MKEVVIHDHCSSYYQLLGVEHRLCKAHHLRKLKASGGDNQAKTIAIQDFLILELMIKSTRNYDEDILKMAINR